MTCITLSNKDPNRWVSIFELTHWKALYNKTLLTTHISPDGNQATTYCKYDCRRPLNRGTSIARERVIVVLAERKCLDQELPMLRLLCGFLHKNYDYINVCWSKRRFLKFTVSYAVFLKYVVFCIRNHTNLFRGVSFWSNLLNTAVRARCRYTQCNPPSRFWTYLSFVLGSGKCVTRTRSERFSYLDPVFAWKRPFN